MLNVFLFWYLICGAIYAGYELANYRGTWRIALPFALLATVGIWPVGLWIQVSRSIRRRRKERWENARREYMAERRAFR